MASESGNGKNTGKILLRPSSLVTIIFLAVTAIALAYIAGVMSGRHGGFAGAAQEAIKAQNPPPETETREPEKILAPEELDFARVLREQAARPKPPEAPEAAESIDPAPGEATDIGLSASENSEKAETGQIFDFLFQLAAFRDEAGADSLRERLEGAGYRTILQKSGKMLVVLVRLRGQESAENELRELAASLRLGAPLLKQKKAVAQ